MLSIARYATFWLAIISLIAINEQFAIMTMDGIKSIEALWPTESQQQLGKTTYRLYIDGAWRNIEGDADWKYLSREDLFKKLGQVYFHQ